MAKLSLEGIISLSHQILKDGKTNIHNVELYQEDFEGIVMLTVEEATKICGAMNPVPRDCKLRDWFEKRIEMATTPNNNEINELDAKRYANAF